MPTLFDSLNVGYSGLKASQVAINTAGHNITNADTEGYVRQRVSFEAATATPPGLQGMGVQVQTIERVFDQLVFNRYKESSANKEKSDYLQQTLETQSTYFPDVDDLGINADMEGWFDQWQALADNPNNAALKVSLAQQTIKLTTHMNETRANIKQLQIDTNSEMNTMIDDVNSIAVEIGNLNAEISEIESDGFTKANDLRDKRGLLEKDLAMLVDAQVYDTQKFGENGEVSGSYNIQVGGFNIVDNSSSHPLKVVSDDNPDGFSSIYYTRQDGRDIPMENYIGGGKIGAVLELRGRTFDSETKTFKDGELQQTLDQLDSLANGLIEATNNIYARGATQSMQSNTLPEMNANTALTTSDQNIQAGTFDVVLYDIDGQEVARRSITIDNSTSLGDNSTPPAPTNSIAYQVYDSIDDNNDNDSTNDINNFVTTTLNYDSSTKSSTFSFGLTTAAETKGYKFAIEDSELAGQGATNFAGALGLSRFFDGDSAQNIDLNATLKDDPTQISAGYTDYSSSNGVALSMVQMQFEKLSFQNSSTNTGETVYEYYNSVATRVGSAADNAAMQNETVTAQLAAVELEYTSISGVSIDEEMTNLIKFQTSYGAAAKVITTIDQMATTLLSIKQ